MVNLRHQFSPINETLVDIVASSYRGLRFKEIVEFAKEAGISRPSVARNLNALTRKGILKKDNSMYRLSKAAINWGHAQRSLFSVLAMHLFDDLYEKAGQGKLSDEEFTKLFTTRIGALAMYTMLVGLGKAEEHPRNGPKEGGKWIEEAFGTLTQKDGWRSCLDRQVFGGEVILKNTIRLGHPLMPEVMVEDDTIYVRPPFAIEHGFAGKVLRELPKIPKERLDLLGNCLKELYPNETDLLDDVQRKINMAVESSKKR